MSGSSLPSGWVPIAGSVSRKATSMALVVTVYTLAAFAMYMLFSSHDVLLKVGSILASTAVIVLGLLVLNGEFWFEQHFMGGVKLRMRLEGKVPAGVVEDLLPTVINRIPFRVGDTEYLDYESRPFLPLVFDALLTVEGVPSIAFFVSRGQAQGEVLVCLSPLFRALVEDVDEAVTAVLGPGPPPPTPSAPYSGVPR